MATTRKYDLYSDPFRAETYATFARMREEDRSLQPGIDGETMLWFVTRHDDAVAVLLDDERFVRDPALALTPDELAAFRAARRTSWRSSTRICSTGTAPTTDGSASRDQGVHAGMSRSCGRGSRRSPTS